MDPVSGSLIESLAQEGGYALILGAVIIMVYLLTKKWINDIGERAQVREAAMNRLLNSQLEQERENADRCREMATKTVDVLNKVAGVMGETNAILAQAIAAFNRNTEAFDRNSEAFDKFIEEFDEWKSMR
jgi:hypothetical protein